VVVGGWSPGDRERERNTHTHTLTHTHRERERERERADSRASKISAEISHNFQFLTDHIGFLVQFCFSKHIVCF